jgi:hypothetical protein
VIIRAGVQAMKPVWTTSTFLIYSGGFTVLGAALAALGYLSSHYGKGGLTGWAAFMLVVLSVIASGFLFQGAWIAAGIFAFASVIAWAALLYLAWSWFGWLNAHPSFSDFSIARLALEFLVLMFAAANAQRFKFPLITLVTAVVGWLFVIDLLSGGGWWTKVVTLFVALMLFAAGSATERPAGFWLHLVSGALLGGVLLSWWHTSDLDWALISAASLIYVVLAYRTRRSSWAVYGTIGFLGATIHYLSGSTTSTSHGLPTSVPTVSGWAPSVAFACLGFWLVLLGLLRVRRRPW